jgi:hypothetical protein
LSCAEMAVPVKAESTAAVITAVRMRLVFIADTAFSCWWTFDCRSVAGSPQRRSGAPVAMKSPAGYPSMSKVIHRVATATNPVIRASAPTRNLL